MFPQPLGPRVLVQVADDSATLTAGGIYLPDSTRESQPSLRGTVLAVGTGWRYDVASDELKFAPLQVGVGDVIVWPCGQQWDVEVDGEVFAVVHEQSILLVLDKALVPGVVPAAV